MADLLREHMLSKWITALETWLSQLTSMKLSDQEDTLDEI